MLDDNRLCPRCGQPVHGSRSMRINPEAPGPVELIRRWFAGDFTALGAIAILGLCVLVVLIGLGLAL